MSAALPAVIVCGPQAGTLPNAASLSRVRSSLLHNPDLRTLKQEITELSELWPLLIATETSLEHVDATPMLQSLTEWIETGDVSALHIDRGTPRNTTLAVLTVLIHIVEYTTFLNQCHPQDLSQIAQWDAHSAVLYSIRDGGFQGLRIGLLSATALACSRTKSDVAKYGSVAMRLALIAGACFDLDEIQATEPKVCLSARWNGKEEAFKAILSSHPKAYIAVQKDVSSAILAAPKSTAISLMRQMEKKGIKTRHVDMEGRFHHIDNSDLCRRLSGFCASLPMLHFTEHCHPIVPLRRHDSADIVVEGKPLHEMVLSCILHEKADWHATLTQSVAAATIQEATEPRVLLLGPVNCISPSVPATVLRPIESLYVYPEHSIAIVGVSCRFAGADTPSRLWDTILAKRSTLGTPPEWRKYPRKGSNEKDQFWGHFLDQADSFDHAFFRKSPREALYMDPQHRIALELAYEALESGGCLSPGSGLLTDDIGCYVGVQSSDYEENVNAQPPTAFSFTGTARAFVSGRISHFFGWTGPSLVIDTGCSSSGVAIHTACRAIQSGECSMALAGGVNIMTSPKSHQNLAAATMRSRTGHCKPFDASADGYCRGEGGGFVVLKKLSSAVANNDRILGVLTGSAINNSKGSSSITAPSVESHEALFRNVLQKAGMHPTQISYVEAHGTGTQRGDPVESHSIRRVFKRSSREEIPLRFGSIKANIGHNEGASGLASLVKVLLMLQHGQIAPQTSFSVLNPAIPSLEEAYMEIPLQVQPWQVPFRAACVNNYGAAGSNTAVIVCQPPAAQAVSPPFLTEHPPQYPFLITANSEGSLNRYICVLLEFIEAQHAPDGDTLLASLAFHSAQRQNHQLGFRKAFSVTSMDELKASLNEETAQSQIHSKPVVLVFAGQTGHRPRLSEEAYRSSFLLRHHLDRCDRTLQSLGLHSLFPHVFGMETTDDLVDLHCTQFSIQYATAMSWIDAGLHVETAVGHSLGQLTALCVSGVLGLRDALKMISGRASLIQRNWNQEQGCMLSVNTDATTVNSLIEQTTGNEKAEIACFNAASSHVIAGSVETIAEIEEAARSAGIKTKKLAITHAFHSQMVDSIMEDYESLIQELKLHPPAFLIEPCAKSSGSWAKITPQLIARQSREPVYFSDAIERIEKRLGPCVWLEAGSAPAGIILARRALTALKTTDKSLHTFCSAQFDSPNAIGSLASTTLNLWREGVRVQFWPFHASQRHCFQPLELPSYQFENTRHWLPWVDGSNMPSEQQQKQRQQETIEAPQLVSFVRHVGGTHSQAAEFSINQDSEEYSTLVRGRTVLGHILCPSSVYLESAIRALSLLPESSVTASTLAPEVQQVQLHAPLGLDPTRSIRLRLQKRFESTWEFTISSYLSDHDEDISSVLQASGILKCRQQDYIKPGPYQPLLRRLIDYERCQRLREDPTASVVQGAFVKKVLDRVANYNDKYFGIRSITSKGSEAVATVDMPEISSQCCAETRFNPPAFDNFLLVAELHAGELDENTSDQVYVCGGIDAVIPHAKYGISESAALGGPFTVYSRLDRESDKTVVGDIFVLAADHKTLSLSILGARFSKIPIRSLQKALQAVNGSAGFHAKEMVSQSEVEKEGRNLLVITPPSESHITSWESSKTSHLEAKSAAAKIFHETTGILSKHLDDDALLSDLGVDSLMAVELQARIKDELHVELPSGKFWEQDMRFGQLCQNIFSRLDIHADSVSDVPQLTPDDTDVSSDSTPARSPSPTSMQTQEKELATSLSDILAEHLNCSTAVPSNTPLVLLGLDSLVAIELKSDLERRFGKKSGQMKIDETTTVSDLCREILAGNSPKMPEFTMTELVKDKRTLNGLYEGKNNDAVAETINSSLSRRKSLTRTSAMEFGHVKQMFGSIAQETGFSGFFSRVYQSQMSLVISYIAKAFSSLGCDLATLHAGEQLPHIPYVPKYQKLVSQYMKVLEEVGLISRRSDHPSDFVRTANPLPQAACSDAHSAILAEFPAYRPEHRLLQVTGPHLADCLAGKTDPLQLLFSSQASRQLLEDVYVRSPMFATATKLLGKLLHRLLLARQNHGMPSEKLRILEIGAGTGATTYHVVDLLLASGLSDAVSYTFTDISPSLVTAARKKFEARYGILKLMEFSVLDIELPPPASALQAYDMIISSNCIHATKSLPRSCDNIQRLLRSDGVLCLLELTRPLPWLDCVFGLLDGWWRFEDERKYVLADEHQWERILLNAGFQQVVWTDDGSRESDQFRLILGLKTGS